MKKVPRVLSTLLALLLTVAMTGCSIFNSGGDWSANKGSGQSVGSSGANKGSTKPGGENAGSENTGGDKTGDGNTGGGNSSSSNTGSGNSSNSNSGGGAREDEPLELEIIEYGYMISNVAGYAYVGIGIRNPNNNYRSDLYTVILTSYDADGKVLSTEETYRGAIYPQEEQYFATLAGDGLSPVKIDVEVITDSIYWEKSTAADQPRYEITNIAEDKTGLVVKISGDIQALNKNGEGTVYINVIFRNSRGEIVGGSPGFAFGVRSDRVTAFDVYVFETPDDYASYELSAQFVL